MDLKGKGEVPGSIHLCIGQEAIPVGAGAVLRSDDYITATYRGHGWGVVAGVSLIDIVAEAIGHASKANGGRAASPYFSSSQCNFIGENSIVGAGVPIACGAALSAIRSQRSQVSVVSIGDGATNQGAFHESLNMAAVLRLPLVIVVENNVYSEMSRIDEMALVEKLALRGSAYGIPGVTVDGNNADAVEAAMVDAVERARSGHGPTIVEALTERLVGHYSGDVQHYRPAGEIERARTVEPLRRLRDSQDAAYSGIFNAIDTEIELEIAEAIDAARALPLPDPATVLEHIYV